MLSALMNMAHGTTSSGLGESGELLQFILVAAHLSAMSSPLTDHAQERNKAPTEL